jgi:hypothetical protein
MIDPKAPTHGLPPSLRIPIAAASVAAIQKYVGTVIGLPVLGRSGPLQGQSVALCIQPHDRALRKDPGVDLWKHGNASTSMDRLHPLRQVWVHVDFDGYRDAYKQFIDQFGLPAIPPGYFLDHVQNRKAIRQRGYTHPYLRLCPVSRTVNTSGGSQYGGEGMEKEYLEYLKGLPAAPPLFQSEIVYADPMDLTKMLDIPPGTGVLEGVRETQKLFFLS